MYLDRNYTPRRRRSYGWLWWMGILISFVLYLYVRQPAWLDQRPLQPTPTPTRSAISWLAEAQLNLARGDFPAAVAAYKEMERLEPTNADPLVAQAQLYMMDRRITQARILTTKAVEVDPENVDALTLHARVLDWFEEYEAAANFALRRAGSGPGQCRDTGRVG